MSALPRVIVVTGPVGAGKTTTAEAFRGVLEPRNESGAVIDVDGLRNAWPVPEGDPFGNRLGTAHLAAMWPNFIETGTRWVVLADVIETDQDRRRLQQALPGAEITVVRLDVPLEVIKERLLGREPDATIDWYLHRAPELQQIMIDNKVGDLVITVTDQSPAEIAEEIVNAVTGRA